MKYSKVLHLLCQFILFFEGVTVVQKKKKNCKISESDVDLVLL